MSKVRIRRKDAELGEFPQDLMPELLKTGFLQADDSYLPAIDGEWAPLSAFERNQAEAQYKQITGKIGSVWSMAKNIAGVAYNDAKKRAGDWVENDPRMKAAQTKLIEDYIPQVRTVILEKVLPAMKARAQELLKDEALLKETIHAAYVAMPMPIRLMFKEEPFTQTLWAQREKLLNGPRFR